MKVLSVHEKVSAFLSAVLYFVTESDLLFTLRIVLRRVDGGRGC